MIDIYYVEYNYLKSTAAKDLHVVKAGLAKSIWHVVDPTNPVKVHAQHIFDRYCMDLSRHALVA